MGQHFKYIADINTVLVTLEGTFTNNDFDRIMKQLAESKQYPSNVNTIIDLSQTDFESITGDFLISLSSRSTLYNEQRSGARVAYICPNDIQFGRMRMWQAYVCLSPIERVVCRSMDEALDWMSKKISS